ncbi:MAG: transposase, partial [Candidatus Paceibacterota bacterium]
LTFFHNFLSMVLFFKALKQNLQIKTLWGHSMNAVQIHLWVAICTYLIVALLKHQIRSPYSVYELMQILGISVFDKTPINELITKEKLKKGIEDQPNLFDNKDL